MVQHIPMALFVPSGGSGGQNILLITSKRRIRLEWMSTYDKKEFIKLCDLI